MTNEQINRMAADAMRGHCCEKFKVAAATPGYCDAKHWTCSGGQKAKRLTPHDELFFTQYLERTVRPL